MSRGSGQPVFRVSHETSWVRYSICERYCIAIIYNISWKWLKHVLQFIFALNTQSLSNMRLFHQVCIQKIASRKTFTFQRQYPKNRMNLWAPYLGLVKPIRCQHWVLPADRFISLHNSPACLETSNPKHQFSDFVCFWSENIYKITSNANPRTL